ncbi:MAG: hypothetical protein A2Y77_07615 [Planctomycetes bacterium RBG_13_62_9]|nr:MAG: hypothetical protein A2Y77_07615 [Planctomycetes bacterium RBG_13_62_9]
MPEILRQIAVDFWATVAEMSPYLLFGFLVAGLLSVFVSQRMVERHLGGQGIGPLLKASLFGIPLPLCSCGVIPVSMSLHKHGASKGATISFLLSTPQTGVDSIFVTYSLLGPVLAIFRPLIALVTGLVGGILVNVFGQSLQYGIRHPPSEDVPPAEEKCAGQCCHAVKPGRKLLDGLRYGFLTLPRDIGKPLLVGLVVAALISAFVPDDFFAEHIGTGLPSMLLMMVVGIPIYVCASASVPVAAAMILKGLSPGAAFVFLMTGPATNAAGLATIWNTLGRRTAILYLVTVAVCALAGGLLLDAIIPHMELAAATHLHDMGPSLFQHLCAVTLLALLGYTLLAPKRG